MSFRQIYKGRVVDLRLEAVALPNGTSIDLEVIRHPGAAAVVPLHEDGCVTLVRQFRHAAGGFLWEIPAGKIDTGEELLACAARELREETGLLAASWLRIGSVLTAPGFCDERIHLFLARQLTRTSQDLGEDEILSVHDVPFERALEMIRNGDIDDAKTIAGLHLAAARLQAET